MSADEVIRERNGLYDKINYYLNSFSTRIGKTCLHT